MNINELCDRLVAVLQDKLGEGYTIKINEVTKTNNVKLKTVTIFEKNKNIAPSLHLKEFMDENEDDVNVEEIAEKILQAYEECKPADSIQMDDFKVFDMIKNRICYKLCNTELNKELLNSLPSIPIFDLSIVFFVDFSHEFIGKGHVNITYKHMEMWGVTTEELMRAAANNTLKTLGLRFENILNVLDSLRTKLAGDRQETEDINIIMEAIGNSCCDKGTMWVLSNNDNCWGTSVILNDGVAKSISDKFKTGYFIIPSSIHELIIIPDDSLAYESDSFEMVCKKLIEMIASVNDTELSKEEILSYNLYYYDCSTDKIKMIEATEVY